MVVRERVLLVVLRVGKQVQGRGLRGEGHEGSRQAAFLLPRVSLGM